VSTATIRLVRAGFPEQQASLLSELFPEMDRGLEPDTAGSYRVVSRPMELLHNSAIAVSCASTAVDEVLASFTIPAGTVGANSIIQIEPLWTYTNSATNKILRVKMGGALVYSVTRTTSTMEIPLIVVANRNSLSSQIQPYVDKYETAAASTPATHAIDFSAAVDVEITGQRASSGDTLTLEYYRVLHFLGV